MHLIENKGVKSECMKFGENSRQMPSVSTICDEYCSMAVTDVFTIMMIAAHRFAISQHVNSLQSRRFLTKTRRYIDRGCHLEKQQKRLRGRGGGRGEGRGGERRKRLPAKPMKLPNGP